ERPASSATIDLPLGNDGCPNNVSNVALRVPVGGIGTHSLQVRVTDAAGTTTTLEERTIDVQDPPQSGPSTVTIAVGNQGSPGSSSAAGGVLGSSSSSTPGGKPAVCQLPELSMKLTSKPLRWVKIDKRRVPVLRSRHRYVFRGRLTCMVDNHRVSAPTGIVLQVLYKIGRHIYYASGRGTLTVHRGQLQAILGYVSSRTIIFRYKPGNGEFAQVNIPIEIAHGHPSGARIRKKSGGSGR
ncbi:MAG TPA: hypothetical protein VN845_04740, partial [Solirubrobacteraceae bacterium]|nr:hypothetical protein [Solirubrobacteraceae bacterium]